MSASPPTTATSSPKLRAMFENGSGEVLLARRAADWADHGVNCVPDRIDPRNFVGQKLEKIKNAGNRNDPRVTKHIERLVIRCQRDPVKMNGESGGEHGQIKINAGERGQSECHREQIQSLHSKIIGAPNVNV